MAGGPARPLRSLRQEPLWLPAGLLAVLATLTLALNAAGGEPAAFSASGDGWRPVGSARGSAAATASTPTSEVSWPRATEGRLEAVAKSPNKLRRGAYRDSAVRPAAHGQATKRGGAWHKLTHRPLRPVRSVVTKRTTMVSDGPLRMAQAGESDFGERLLDEIETPFDGSAPADNEPAPKPFEDTPMEAGPLPGFGEPSVDEPAIRTPDSDDTTPGGAFAPEVETLPPLDDPEVPFGSSGDLTQPRAEVEEAPGGDAGVIDPLDSVPMDDSEEDDLADMLSDGPADGDLEARDKQEYRKRQREASKDCAEELAELKAKRLNTLDITIGVTGEEGTDYPFNCSIDDGTPFAPRCWPQVTYMWKASGLCHKPLYFESVGLERYGHSWGPCLDPVISGVHFFGRIPALPYMMGLQAPCECVYTLGHYRPGSCAPYTIDPLPITGRAAAWEAAAVTGGIFLIP